MALIHCSECKTKISDKANICPKCGHHYHVEQYSIKDGQKREGFYGRTLKSNNRKYLVGLTASLIVIISTITLYSLFHNNEYIRNVIVLTALAVLFGGAVIAGLVSNRRNLNRLSSFGQLSDIENSLEIQLNDVQSVDEFDRYIITKDWLLATRGDTFLMPLSDLVWIYRKVENRKIGRDHQLVLYFNTNKTKKTLQISEGKANALALSIAKRAPNAFRDYTKENIDMYQTRTLYTEWEKRKGIIGD